MATKSWLDCLSSDEEEEVVDNEKVRRILAERLRRRKEESEVACAPALQRSHTVGGISSSRRSPAVVNYGLESILPASPSSSVSGGSPSRRSNRVGARGRGNRGGLMRTSTVQCVRGKEHADQTPKKFSFGFISSILVDEEDEAKEQADGHGGETADTKQAASAQGAATSAQGAATSAHGAATSAPISPNNTLKKTVTAWISNRADEKVSGSGVSTNAPDDDSEETAASPKALTKYYPEYDAPYQMQALQRARDVCN